MLLGTAGRQQPEVDAVRLLERGRRRGRRLHRRLRRGRASPDVASRHRAEPELRPLSAAGQGDLPHPPARRPHRRSAQLLHGQLASDIPSTCTAPRPRACRSRQVPSGSRGADDLPGRADAGHSRRARPHAPRLRVQREPPGARRRPQGRHAVGARPRDRRATRWLRARHRPRSRRRRVEQAGRVTRHGAGRHLSGGRARCDGERRPRAARAGVPGARLSLRHAHRLGRVLRRHR